MADGRQRSEWNQTAQLLAMIYNAHRSPKARLMKPAEFHPFGSRRMAACPHAFPKIKDLSILKMVFVKE